MGLWVHRLVFVHAVCPFMIYGEVVQKWRLAKGATLRKWPHAAGMPHAHTHAHAHAHTHTHARTHTRTVFGLQQFALVSV